ncbi:acyltransferase family protein [Sphingomonas japonica]|uniref:Acyltransferase 3 domain-containing protein n=1 Tax=Sphingomonas japonica TaxID=511662 RepID=A0ABX0TWA2_9SPHN|nr:acyltransferase family protein [Sphingomonas japonica]NIJ22604.1 hypothetical protein [Sphingomonas japonica]
MRIEPSSAFTIRRNERHYGLDWLRIAAFALLILYHIGMVFGPWPWVIHSPHRYWQVVPLLSLLSPWRLALLFAVSGYASRKLLARSGGLRRFTASRNRRLLIPFAFGMAVLVPIEMYIQVADRGYPHGYLHFWSSDYWRWGSFYGKQFPAYEHLWFVIYLWAYTLVLAAALRIGGARLDCLVARALVWLRGGTRILWVPIVLLSIAKLGMMFVIPDETGLLTDWTGHAFYLPMLVAGFILAGAPALWPTIASVWRPAALTAIVAGSIIVAIDLAYLDTMPSHIWAMVDRTARNAMAWSMVLVLFLAADRFLNRDHRWRATLGEAVFPFYLIHHSAIVVTAWATLPLAFDPWSQFAILLAATGTACALFYLIGRRIGWLRPLIGLRSRVASRG